MNRNTVKAGCWRMGKEIKIIIADDNRNFCQMLQNYLQGQEDLSIVGVANNGLEAWELIQTQEPDLIILDLVMPNLDGLGVLERINTRTTMTRPKIIMLTAFGQESLTHQAMMLGVDYFILKPFDLDILSKRIRSLTQDMPSVHSCSVFFFSFSNRDNGGKRAQS